MSLFRIYCSMVLTALFWSGAFITGKLAITQFPPFALTFFRFLIGFGIIFFILRYQQPDNWLPNHRQWPAVALLGIIGTFGYHALFFSALKFTTAINASLIGSSNPMVTSLLAAICLRERMAIDRWGGVLLSFAGVFLIITNGDWTTIRTFQFNQGDILMFSAVWCWALYSILSRRMMNRYDISPLMLTTYTFGICSIVSIPFFLYEQPAAYLPLTTWGGWLSIAYMAFFSSVLGYLFHLIAVQRIGAARASNFVNLVPIFTIVLSILILGENFSLFKFSCAAATMLGVYITTRPDNISAKVAL